MSGVFRETTVEKAAFTWLESLGWVVKHGSEIAPGELFSERSGAARLLLDSGSWMQCY